MTEAQRIKKYYMRPAIRRIETEWHDRLENVFHVDEFIWVDQRMKEYRVAIPEVVNAWAGDEFHYRMAHAVRTRMLTYVPTGRIVYDCTLPEEKAIVFEYRLEQCTRALT